MASRKNGGSSGSKTFERVKDAAVQLEVLTGRRPEKVLGLEHGDNGWKISFELLEMQRIPRSTDLLGCYVVEVDDDGELVGYERSQRYQRGHASGES
ncbi:MAG TPA: gas vesicle protein GvpO [Thermoleophilaceae bacterium]